MKFIKASEIELLLFRHTGRKYRISKAEFNTFVEYADCYSLCKLISNHDFRIELTGMEWIDFYANNSGRVSTIFDGIDVGRLNRAFYTSSIKIQINMIKYMTERRLFRPLIIEYIGYEATFGSKRLEKVKVSITCPEWSYYCESLAIEKFDKE